MNAESRLNDVPSDERLVPMTRRDLCRWFAMAVFWAFVIGFPELKSINTATNRYFLHWSWSTATAYLACYGVIVVLIFAAIMTIRRCYPMRKSLNIGAVAVLLVLFQLLWSQFLSQRTSLLVALVRDAPAVVVVSCLIAWCAFRQSIPLNKLGSFFGTASVVFMPTILCFWLTALYACIANPPADHATVVTQQPHGRKEDRDIVELQKSLAVQDQSLATLTPVTDKPRAIYLFVFDGWSYRLTHNQGEIDSSFPHLATFVDQAIAFSDAHSPGCHTCTSMPRFLFQRTDLFALRGSEPGFWDGARFVAAASQPTLLSQARQRGYKTSLVGWYHDYKRLVGDSADENFTVCYYDHLGKSLSARAVTFFWQLASKTMGPHLSALTVGDYFVLRNYAFVRQTALLNEKVSEILAQQAVNQFGVFHLSLPHWPFCMAKDGPKPLNQSYGNSSPHHARQHMRYMDTTLGGFMDVLKADDKFNEALIVLVSDHTWRHDPEISMTSAERTHVPMFVKLPHQQSPCRVDASFSTNHLLALIDYLSTIGDEEGGLTVESVNGISTFIQSNQFYEQLDDDEVFIRYPKVVN